MSRVESKIKTFDQILDEVDKLRESGKTIVTYNGSFDILHIGHIVSIAEAKAQGDVLIIPLNSDKSVSLYKGPNRPIVPELERAEMLAALSDTDYIFLFDEINPIRVLRAIKPDIHCNGSDWGEGCVERDIVEANGGRVHILKWRPGHSTTDIVKKMLEVYKEPTVKAVFLDRDKTINHDPGYIHKIKDFKFLPGVLKALKRLSDSEYRIIIVTGQSGIGRGYFTEEDFHTLNDWMLEQMGNKGIVIDKVYFCPHHPDDGCECRKPNIGMLLQAVEEFGISLNDSWMVGDKLEDVETGRNANTKTIKIGNKVGPSLKLEPHHYAKNLQQAVEIILGK